VHRFLGIESIVRGVWVWDSVPGLSMLDLSWHLYAAFSNRRRYNIPYHFNSLQSNGILSIPPSIPPQYVAVRASDHLT
jgi:hypothetical protein